MTSPPDDREFTDKELEFIDDAVGYLVNGHCCGDDSAAGREMADQIKYKVALIRLAQSNRDHAADGAAPG